MKIYEYKNCSTCKKALKFLDQLKIQYERIPIVDKPPTLSELKTMLSIIKSQGGSLKNLFNTSGELYRTLNISKKIQAGMTESEALTLLSKNGKLIKRPFLLNNGSGTVGFREDIWKKLFR